jgi:hypothetical protein
MLQTGHFPARIMKSSFRPSVVFLTSLALWGCKTGAIGVEACRKVEAARCEAANSCGLVGSLTECIRFSHDNCLHGFGANADPRPSDVDSCVEALQAANQCVIERGDVTPAQCKNELLSDSRADKICNFVISPELTPQCLFLAPDSEEAEPTKKPTESKTPEEEEEPSPEDAGAASNADAASE